MIMRLHFWYSVCVSFIAGLTIAGGPGNVSAQDGWEALDPQTSEDIFGIDFVDPANGWIVGSNGFVARTTDGGLNWSSQNSRVSKNLNAVSFVDPWVGWAAGDNGALIRTTNAGVDWTEVPGVVEGHIAELVFWDAWSGWAVAQGSAQSMLRTSDGGSSWNVYFLNTGFPGHSIFVLDSMNAFVCGGFFDWIGYTSRSTDGGLTWNDILPISSEPIFDLFFFDESNGFAVGGDIDFGATAWKTGDGGASWQSVGAPLVLQPLLSVKFVNADSAWAVGAGGRLFKYRSSPPEWISYESGTNFNIFELDFVDAQHGWICGANGFVARYRPIVTDLREDRGRVPDDFVLEQNFPNPFNPSTSIGLQVPAGGGHVVLEIFNLLGKRVRTLVDETPGPGRRIVFWDGKNQDGLEVSSGVYVYMLRTSVGVSTRKMLLIR